MPDPVRYTAYQANSAKAWSKDFRSGALLNSDPQHAYNRCFLNVIVQFLSGFPDILAGLKSSFKAAGVLGTQTWTESLANSLVLAIQHVRTKAWTNEAGDIFQFVCKLGKIPLTKHIVQWLAEKTLVQQDAEESLRAILSALEAESSDVLSQAFPHAPADQVSTYYSSLLYTSTRTKASCPNSANCFTGDTLQPVLKSMQLLKAKLTGDAITIAQLVESSMQPSLADCIECFKKGLVNSVTTTDFRLSLPDVMPVMAGRERVVGPGRKSTRSFTAIKLEETASVSYGINQENCKEYELRRVMIYVGSSSFGGHYTCAERVQTADCYQQGDKWRYLDSGKTPIELSLAQLYSEHGRGVAGLLLVAKAQPGAIKGVKPVVLAEQQPSSLPKSVASNVPAPTALETSLSCSQLNPEVKRVVRKTEKAWAEAKRERLAQFPGKAEQGQQKQQAALARQQAYASAMTSSAAYLPVAKPAGVTNAAVPSGKLSAKELKRQNKLQKKAKLTLDGIVITNQPASAASSPRTDSPASSGQAPTARGVSTPTPPAITFSAAPTPAVKTSSTAPAPAAAGLAAVGKPSKAGPTPTPPATKVSAARPIAPAPAAVALAAVEKHSRAGPTPNPPATPSAALPTTKKLSKAAQPPAPSAAKSSPSKLPGPHNPVSPLAPALANTAHPGPDQASSGSGGGAKQTIAAAAGLVWGSEGWQGIAAISQPAAASEPMHTAGPPLTLPLPSMQAASLDVEAQVEEEQEAQVEEEQEEQEAEEEAKDEAADSAEVQLHLLAMSAPASHECRVKWQAERHPLRWTVLSVAAVSGNLLGKTAAVISHRRARFTSLLNRQASTDKPETHQRQHQ